MRKWLAGILGFVLVTATVSTISAQTQTKKASDDFTFASDVRVGNQVLKAGDYHFVCDAKGLTISRITVRTGGDSYMTKIATVPVKQQSLSGKSEHSELQMPKGSDGVPQVESVKIQGSNVEYLIQQ